MTLAITKTYTPSSGQVANSSSYNTDIAVLFNAFSGLEAQTSTLGGLTVTPTANSTTVFKITNAAGTELMSADTTNSYLKLKGTARLYFDGGSTTYLSEVAATKLGISGCDIGITATKKIYLDGIAGTGNTYLYESGADVMDLYVGGANMLKLTNSTDDTVAIAGILTIVPNTAATGLDIDQNGNALALNINSSSASSTADCVNVTNVGVHHGMLLTQTGVLASGYNGLFIYATAAQTNTDGLLKVHQDHASSSQDCIDVINDGTGAAMYLLGNNVTGANVVAKFVHDGNHNNAYGIDIQCGTDNGSGTNYIATFEDGNGDPVGSITYATATTAYNTTSDIRLKKDITDSRYGIAQLMQLRVNDFRFIKNDFEGTGLMAQQVLDVYPPAVSRPNEENGVWGIDYGKFTPLIISAVQDINKRLEALEKKGVK